MIGLNVHHNFTRAQCAGYAPLHLIRNVVRFFYVECAIHRDSQFGKHFTFAATRAHGKTVAHTLC